MEDAAAGQRVQLLELHEFVARVQAQDSSEEEPVGAGGEVLQRRRRVGAGADAMAGKVLPGLVAGVHQAVDREPPLAPASGPGPQRPREVLVRGEQEPGPTAALGRRQSAAEQRLQHGEVELRLVDRLVRVGGRRPADDRRTGGRGPPAESVKVRQAPLGRPQQVEGIERRHPCPPLHQVDPRVGSDQRTTRRAGGQPQQELFPAGAIDVDSKAKTRSTQGAAALVEQERVLAGAPREDSLGEAGYEDEVEGSPGRLLHRPHEDASVAALRRLAPAQPQAFAEHALDLGQVDLIDLRERPEFGQHLEHGLRVPERHRRQPAETIEPDAPVGALRQIVQKLDQGQREVPERAETRDLTLEVAATALTFVGGLAKLQPELGVESLQALPPAPGAAHHRRVHQQPLPPRRGPERAGGRRVFPGVVDILRAGGRWRGLRGRRLVRLEHELLAGRLHPGHILDLRRRTIRGRLRRLAERQILREAARREPFTGAGEQGQESATGRVGVQRTPRDVGGDSGTPERVLHQGQVGRRLAHEDGDAVEGQTAGGGTADTTGDLDALLALPRGREQVDGRRLLRWRRPLGVHTRLEDEALHATERGPRSAVRVRVDVGHGLLAEHRRQPLQRLAVARGDGRHDLPAAPGKGPQHVGLDAAAHRKVEPDRARRHDRPPLREGLRGQPEDGAPVRQSESLHLAREALEQAAQVPRALIPGQRRRRNAGRAQFAERRRQRTGESRHARDRRQTLQFPLGLRQPRGAGRDCLGAERCDGAQTAGRQVERGRLERPLTERQRVNAQQAATAPRQAAQQVIRGAAGRPEQQDLLTGLQTLAEPPSGRRQADPGGGRNQDRRRWQIRHGSGGGMSSSAASRLRPRT